MSGILLFLGTIAPPDRKPAAAMTGPSGQLAQYGKFSPLDSKPGKNKI